MVFDINHHTPNEPGPAKILDARGRELKRVIRANTVTGEVTEIHGQKRIEKRYPAPLALIVAVLLAFCMGLRAETVAERLDDGIPSGSGAITPTKGSLWVANGTSFLPLGVGTNGQVLTADSAQATGIKWATGGSGGSSPFADDTAILKNATDTSKLLRFDLSGITTATTRVITPPNADTKLPIATQFITWSGPSSSRTYTLPDANKTLLASDGDGSSLTNLPAQLPATDTTAIIKGSGDATKLVRFEVDGLTTSTTRVVTPPDANTSLPVMAYNHTFSGPTAARTYTLPDANKTLLATDGNGSALTNLDAGNIATGTLGVARGGTGVATLTAYAPIFGGTTGTGAVQSGTVGSSGQVLTSNGPGALPTFQAAAAGLPVDQNTAVVKGHSDNTKLLAFDIDTNGTTGTTRTLKAPVTNGTIITDNTVLFSWLDAATSGTANAGAYTVTNKYFISKSCTITGMRIYYPDTTSRSVKFVVYDLGGTLLYSESNTYNTAGLKSFTFATPLSVTAYKGLYIGVYTSSIWATVTLPTGITTYTPGNTRMFMPHVLMVGTGYYKTSDAAPDSTYGSTDPFASEPIITVP